MHNIGCGWAALPQRCFPGPYFVPFDPFPAPVASPRPNEKHFFLQDRQWEAQGCSQHFALTDLSAEMKSLPEDSQCIPGSHLLGQVSSASQDRSQPGPQRQHHQHNLHFTPCAGSWGCKPHDWPAEEKSFPVQSCRKPSSHEVSSPPATAHSLVPAGAEQGEEASSSVPAPGAPALSKSPASLLAGSSRKERA